MPWLPISLLLAIVAGSAGQDAPPKKAADKPDTEFPALLSAKPLEEDPGDDALRKLLKARYNAALEEARWEYWFHKWAPGAGVAMADDQEQGYGPWQRVLQAGLEVFDKPAEKVALLEGYLELVREDERAEQQRGTKPGGTPSATSTGPVTNDWLRRPGYFVRSAKPERRGESESSSGGCSVKTADKSVLLKSILLVVTLAGTSAAQTPPAQDADDEPAVKLPALVSAKPLPPVPGEDESRKLLREKRNEAVAAARSSYEEFMKGRGRSDDMYRSCQRVVEAGLELCATPAEKVALLTQLVEVMAEVDKDMQSRHAVARASAGDVHRARYERLDAEVRLLRAKRDAERPAGK